MSEFQPLIDQLYREEVLRARRQTAEQRMDEGLALSASLFAKDSPELRRRLRLERQLRERECYGPPQPRR